jgi:hypothetical protein
LPIIWIYGNKDDDDDDDSVQLLTCPISCKMMYRDEINQIKWQKLRDALLLGA